LRDGKKLPSQIVPRKLEGEIKETACSQIQTRKARKGRLRAKWSHPQGVDMQLWVKYLKSGLVPVKTSPGATNRGFLMWVGTKAHPQDPRCPKNCSKTQPRLQKTRRENPREPKKKKKYSNNPINAVGGPPGVLKELNGACPLINLPFRWSHRLSQRTALILTGRPGRGSLPQPFVEMFHLCGYPQEKKEQTPSNFRKHISIIRPSQKKGIPMKQAFKKLTVWCPKRLGRKRTFEFRHLRNWRLENCESNQTQEGNAA